MKRIPTCVKCGGVHYNMHPCGTHEAVGYAIQPVRVQYRRPRFTEDGEALDWGDRLRTVVSLPGNRVGLPRKAQEVR